MLHVIFLLIGLTFAPNLWALRQGSAIPQAKLVNRYERRCGYSCAQELAIDLGADPTESDSVVAVRFCSKEPLPLALYSSAAAFGYVISILIDSYAYTPERILYLRSEDCLGPVGAVTATEFWAIPPGAALPTSVETVKSSQVLVDSLEMEELIGNAQSYKAGLQKLPEKLRANPDALGIVVGYYYKHPSRLLKRRLGEVQNTLRKSGLSEDRYSIRLSPWTGEYGEDDPEPKYPRFFVVEVAKANDGAQK